MQTKRTVVLSNIRAEMARREIQHSDLATALGLTRAAVSLKLRGKRPLTVDELFVIADRLGVSTALLTDEKVAP